MWQCLSRISFSQAILPEPLGGTALVPAKRLGERSRFTVTDFPADLGDGQRRFSEKPFGFPHPLPRHVGRRRKACRLLEEPFHLRLAHIKFGREPRARQIAAKVPSDIRARPVDCRKVLVGHSGPAAIRPGCALHHEGDGFGDNPFVKQIRRDPPPRLDMNAPCEASRQAPEGRAARLRPQTPCGRLLFRRSDSADNPDNNLARW